MENPKIVLIINALVESYDYAYEMDEEYVESISLSKSFNFSEKEIASILNLFNKIVSMVPALVNIKNKSEIFEKIKASKIDKSLVKSVLSLTNKLRRKIKEKGKEKKVKRKSKDHFFEQLIMEGMKSDKNMINGAIIDFENILATEKSTMKWSELSEKVGLPQVYRFWVLKGANAGIWTGKVLWTKDEGKSYGILWADGYYTEEPLDEDVFWFSKPTEEITFHIEGEEYIPQKLLNDIIIKYSTSPQNVLDLYNRFINNPPIERILSGKMRMNYQSRLLQGLIESQKKNFIRKMTAHFRKGEAHPFNIEGSEIKLKFKHIKGDGRCMYRSAASGLNLLCNGDEEEEGTIKWKSGNERETAIAELIMLCSILAIESNINQQRFTMERLANEGEEMGHTYGDIVNISRPSNYIQKMLMMKSTSGLSSDFWGDDTELNAFVNYVIPEIRVGVFNEMYGEQLLNGVVLRSNNNREANPPTICLLFTGNHFNALYENNKGSLNITRAELIARLINYVYILMKDTGRIEIFKTKLKFILESFSESETEQILAIWSSYDEDELEYILDIIGSLSEISEERSEHRKKQKRGGGKKYKRRKRY
jgi:hypothetical protein